MANSGPSRAAQAILAGNSEATISMLQMVIQICNSSASVVDSITTLNVIQIVNMFIFAANVRKKSMRKEIAKKNDSLIISKWTFFCLSFQNFFRIFSSTHQHFFWQITAHYEQKNERNDCKIIWINCISTFFTKSSFMKPALITQIWNSESLI